MSRMTHSVLALAVGLAASTPAAAMYAPVDVQGRFASLHAKVYLAHHNGPGKPPGDPGIGDRVARTKKALVALAPRLDALLAALRKADRSYRAWILEGPAVAGGEGAPVVEVGIDHGALSRCKAGAIPNLSVHIRVPAAADALLTAWTEMIVRRLWRGLCAAPGPKEARATAGMLAELEKAAAGSSMDWIEQELSGRIVAADARRLLAIAAARPHTRPVVARLLAELPSTSGRTLAPLLAGCQGTACGAVVASLAAVPGGLGVLRKRKDRARLLAEGLGVAADPKASEKTQAARRALGLR